jgi:8-hydroxy-5-deazaflavin:NADPH oxidoreductase
MNRNVVVVGAGPVGTALGRGLERCGHTVSLAVRDPSDGKYDDLRTEHALRPLADDLASEHVVVLAVPAPALADVVPGLALRPGQVVVDATNAVRSPLPDGFDSVGSYVASLLPDGVDVVKAFNTIGAEHLSSGRVGGTAVFLPMAGDERGRGVVAELATAMGFEPADLGGREMIGMVEDHARLWIHLAFACGWGRQFGFTAIRP